MKHRAAGCLLIVVVAIIWLAIGAAFLTGHFPRRLFDSSHWRQAGAVNSDVWRVSMVDDLMGSGRLHDLPRSEVLAVLGPPTPTDKFADHDLVYWLGPERGFLRIDSEWLLIDFDPSGRVATYEIGRD